MASTAPPGRRFGKKTSGLLLILFIVGIYVLQNKAVMPFVESVVESDLFDADTSELEGKDRGRVAFSQCNDFILADRGNNGPIQFAGEDYRSWELASGRYLISSHILQTDESGKRERKNYACNVQFTGGDEADRANWKLLGLDLQDP